MSLFVHKYGGTSVGSADKIKAIAARLKEIKSSGHSLVVVVSAMGDSTDELISLAEEVSPSIKTGAHPREMDMLLTVGERISMALLSMALRDLGVEAISFTGSQAGIITDESHTNAKIIEIKPIRIIDAIRAGKVVILAGFQGVSVTKEITTLGRGGSDTTAIAMAGELSKTFEDVHCEVYTDVEGVYSADPRKIPSAKRYDRLPLSIVLEMAKTGAQVMHSRSIEFAIQNGARVSVLHSVSRKGSVLVPDSDFKDELSGVVAVTVKDTLVSMVCRSISSELIKCAKELLLNEKIEVLDLTAQALSITFSIREPDTLRAATCLHKEFIAS